MAVDDNVFELARLGRDMRKAQKHRDSARTADALATAKRYEERFDHALRVILEFTTPSLFDSPAGAAAPAVATASPPGPTSPAAVRVASLPGWADRLARLDRAAGGRGVQVTLSRHAEAVGCDTRPLPRVCDLTPEQFDRLCVAAEAASGKAVPS